MTINRSQLVVVEWVDPTSSDGWVDSDDVKEFLNNENFVAETAGWLIAEDDVAIVIGSTITVTDKYCGQMFRVPKSAIRKITYMTTSEPDGEPAQDAADDDLIIEED